MNGLMMNYPLTLPHILERAGKLFPTVEIVTRNPDKSLHRYTYGDFYRRSRQLASALQKAGLRRGDRVATLSWNHWRHLECYFGIPVAGGVLHTLNLRLFPKDISYIANHAEDRFLIVDDVLLPLYEQFRNDVKFEKVIVVPFGGPAPQGFDDYEKFIATGSEDFTYPDLDENAALGICYTSGTTGNPKGVVYSHRAVVLHSLVSALPDVHGLSQYDSVCPVVPMFHANAWGLPFVCAMTGTKQVFPGSHLDAESILDLFAREKVNCSAGVPTIWLGILEALEKNPGKWKLEPEIRMAVGGSAAPEALIRKLDRFGLKIIHLWGMTELTPLGTCSKVKASQQGLAEDQKYAIRIKQGTPVPLIDARIRNEKGDAPWDGETMGELQVRGPFVAASYLKLEGGDDKWTEDGWFRTGDVATIDPEGFVKLTDRTKDLIKTGGEWISSVDLENAIMGHPAVKEAAVIAVPHPKWAERPLAVVVLKDGQKATADDIRDFLAPKFAKWWLPDAVDFIDAIPRTSTGKFLKTALRDRYQDWKW